MLSYNPYKRPNIKGTASLEFLQPYNRYTNIRYISQGELFHPIYTWWRWARFGYPLVDGMFVVGGCAREGCN